MTDRGWTDVTLHDLIRVKHGWPFASDCFSDDLTGLPIVVAVGNFNYSGGFRFESTPVKEYRGDYPKEYELKPDEILLVMTCQTPGGEILGIPAKVPDDGRVYLHNQRLGKVAVSRPDLVDPNFLYYVFLWREFNDELVASSTGTKIVHTAPSRIEAFRFTLPPLDRQRAIASILGALDEKINLNRQVNRWLEELMSALFKSWFVDFDAVLARRDGRTAAGVPHAAVDLFPSHFEDTELGPIPKGWTIAPLDSVADFLNGLALQNYPPTQPDTIPVIKIAELRAGTALSADRCSAVPQDYCIDDGDVVFSWSGSLMADVWCGGRGALNQHLFKVTSKLFPKWYYFGWINEHLPEFQAIAADKATTMGHIRRLHLTAAKVVVPPDPLLKALTAIQEPILDRVIQNRVESRELEELRNALVAPLLSGDVAITTAERIVAEAI